MNQKYDIIIIGAGIVGAMTARFLSQYSVKTLWLEKESDIGMGATSANSAIIHSGHDPKPGSLKAEMNTLGNHKWKQLVRELDIPYRDTGAYVVAIGSEQFKQLEPLYRRGVENGIPGLRIIKRGEMFSREPLLNPKTTGGLWTPTAGVIDPFFAVVATAENAVVNGVELLRETSFEDFIMENGRIVGVKTNKGDFACDWVINSAGLYSDEVMHKAGVRPEFKITPRRGEYLIFDESKIKLNNVLFPLPTKKSKGTLVSTTTHGNVMIGPNANIVDTKDNTDTASEGLNEILENAKQLVPSLNGRDVIASYAGIRATGNANKDFVIEILDNGLVNLGGIESPGFASAPAIAERVVDMLKDKGLNLVQKSDWQPYREAPPVFSHLSHKERGDLVKQNPAYGRIVCRCEEVTEGEIIRAINSPIPATTYDAIKRRTWLGTGRCQGGFDYPRVIEILAEELGVEIEDVSKKGRGSEFVYRRTKDVG